MVDHNNAITMSGDELPRLGEDTPQTQMVERMLASLRRGWTPTPGNLEEARNLALAWTQYDQQVLEPPVGSFVGASNEMAEPLAYLSFRTLVPRDLSDPESWGPKEWDSQGMSPEQGRRVLTMNRPYGILPGWDRGLLEAG